METVFVIAIGIQISLSILTIRSILNVNHLTRQKLIKKSIYKVCKEVPGNKKDVEYALIHQPQNGSPFRIVMHLN